jgi:hypothetical protein
LVMESRGQVTVELPYIQYEKSLLLCWRSFLGGGSDIITGIFAYKGSKWCDYGSRSLQSTWIIQHA